jgi:phosphatidylglycerophosphatase C
MLDFQVETLFEPLFSGRSKGAVAFDADGTLWQGDVGEELLRWLRPGLYAEYERRVAADPPDGFAFAAAVLEGLAEDALLATCRELFARRFEGQVFAFARQLIERLRAAGVEIWIVSASPWWPVVAGAEALGIPSSHVIAVQTRVHEGRLTSEVVQPVPTLEGKVLGLSARGVRPVVAAGNSPLDIPMLCAAQKAFVVIPHGEHGEMAREANARGWPIQRG